MPPPSPNIRVERVTDALSEALATFFHDVWNSTASASEVERARAEANATNPLGAGTDIPAVAYVRDGVILGYLATIPVRFWNGEREMPGHWLKGFMVLPEFRNGPVGFALLKELLKHVDVSGIMTVATPARRLFEAVGYADCGTLPNYLAVLRPARVASRVDASQLGLGVPAAATRAIDIAQRTGVAWLGGAFGGAALALWRTLRGGTGGFTVSTGALADAAAVDALWLRVRSSLTAGAVRDAAMLSWRYAAAAGQTYEAVNVSSGDRLVGLAIVRRPRESSDPRLRGLRVATISDLLFDGARAGVAAVAGAERLSRALGADALLCSASHPSIVAALRHRSFVRLPGNVHLLLRDPGKTSGLSRDAGAWWVTRGDASSDEVF